MGFSAQGFLPLSRRGLFNLSLPRLVTLRRRKPLVSRVKTLRKDGNVRPLPLLIPLCDALVDFMGNFQLTHNEQLLHAIFMLKKR